MPTAQFKWTRGIIILNTFIITSCGSMGNSELSRQERLECGQVYNSTYQAALLRLEGHSRNELFQYLSEYGKDNGIPFKGSTHELILQSAYENIFYYPEMTDEDKKEEATEFASFFYDRCMDDR